MHYQIYRTFSDRLAKELRRQLQEDKREARQLLGRPLKAVDHEELCDLAVKLQIQGLLEHSTGQVLPLEVAVLIEEWQYRQAGRHVYFPLPGLLDALYDSKMEVDPAAFIAPRNLFSLAIPQGELVGGLPLPPFLAACCTCEEKQAMTERFNRSKAAYTALALQTDAQPGTQSLFVTNNGNNHVVRCSLPLRLLPIILQNPAGEDREGEFLHSLLGNYDGVPGVVPLSSEESRIHYRLVKSIVHLTLYMQAFPASVKEGYPEQFVDNGSSGYRGWSPHTVGSSHFHAERGSPIGHWRRKHFRSYPLRRDGGRKAGLVEVKGTWVNPDSPHTVVAVGE